MNLLICLLLGVLIGLIIHRFYFEDMKKSKSSKPPSPYRDWNQSPDELADLYTEKQLQEMIKILHDAASIVIYNPFTYSMIGGFDINEEKEPKPRAICQSSNPFEYALSVKLTQALAIRRLREVKL